jgi:hypothetical protein
MKGVPIPQLSCYVSPSEPLVAVRNERQRPKSPSPDYSLNLVAKKERML